MKSVLVIGSSRGLGKSIIREYAKHNYNVGITYLEHEKEAKKFAKEIRKEYGVGTLVYKCDITREIDVIYLFNEFLNKFKSIDVLVNNAGIGRDVNLDLKIKDEFMRTLEVNLVGPFISSRVIGSYMYDHGHGCIINVSSNNGIDSYYEESIDYDSSKAGLINLSHNLANHFAPYVRVNCICPGWIDTESNNDMNPYFREEQTSKILLNRFASEEEIAKVIYFLGSDEASYVNDCIIKVDGGKKC